MPDEAFPKQPTPPGDPTQGLDAVRDRFDEDWRAGRPLRIEDCLGEVADAARPRLLRNLVALEIELREGAGEKPTANEYQARFPDLDSLWLAAIFAAPDTEVPNPRITPPVSTLDPSLVGAAPTTRARRIRCPHCHNPIQIIDEQSNDVLCPGCGSSFTVREARHTDTTSGSRPLGKYQLLERVGLGAFGAVWKARDTELDRIVALKIAHTGLLTNDAELERFKREARAAAQLRHPGIVTVYDVETLDGLPTIVSDFINGAPLRDLLQTRGLTFREAAILIADVAEAVHYAHSLGVVHRDLKPANIMVEYGASHPAPAQANAPSPTLRPLVADFGLALRSDAEVTMTLDGHIIGTPAYMSPEQAAGKAHAADARSDVYSLGVIFYELLTGELPFRGSRVMMISQVLHEEPRSPRRVKDKIPRDLETVCLKCLRKEPGRRYQSGRELAEDLRRWLNGMPVHARPVGNVERAIKWARRRPAAAALLGVIFLAPFALSAGVLIYNQQIEQTRRATRAAALVNSLASAESTSVPRIIEDLEAYRVEADPLLRQMVDDQPKGSKGRLHASLALLQVDPERADVLLGHLLDATPQELVVIRAALTPSKDGINDGLWAMVEDGPAHPQKRFRAACALAALDPHNPRWDMAAPGVAAHLVGENPLLVGQWTEALQLVHLRLLPPLTQLATSTVKTDQGRQADYKLAFANNQKRMVATSIVSEYAADQPATLVDVLTTGDEEQFATVFPKLQRHRAQAISLLEAVLQQPFSVDANDADRNPLAARQANAAVALVKLSHAEKVWPLLRHRPDPSVRSYLIHRLCALGTEPQVLWRQFEVEKDISARRALLLGLGEYGVATSGPLVDHLLDLYRTDPDPGLHAAATWTLRQWGQKDKLAAIDKDLAKMLLVPPLGGAALPSKGGTTNTPNTPRWFINGQGQTMVVIPGPVEFVMGSPSTEDQRDHTPLAESQHPRRINRTFAIAAKPVTVRDYLRHRKDYAYMPRYAPEEDCPVHGTTWYEAASYCNWLSEQEGILKDQWCYLPNEKGEFAEGMKLVPDYLQRTGYRLPTEAEWEYACRANAASIRYYGESEELLGAYGWYVQNSRERSWPERSKMPNDFGRERSWPVGSKKPNDFGLFDMHGNVWNWCQETYKAYPEREVGMVFDDMEDSLSINNQDFRVLRGGSYVRRGSFIRSADRGKRGPTDNGNDVGFRPARTLR